MLEAILRTGMVSLSFQLNMELVSEPYCRVPCRMWDAGCLESKGSLWLSVVHV